MAFKHLKLFISDKERIFFWEQKLCDFIKISFLADLKIKNTIF